MRNCFAKKCILGVLAVALLMTAVPNYRESALAAEQQKMPYRSGESLDSDSAEWIGEAGEALTEIAEERAIMALVYLSDTYPVRKQASLDSAAVVTVRSGQQVNILDVYVDDDYMVWEYVRLEFKGEEYFGYIPRSSLACSDARFLEWEEQYGMNPSRSTYSLEESAVDVEQFPASYQPALLALKKLHPNWIFVKMNTGLDWDTVIYNEMQGGKSLVYKTFPEWAKNGLYDSGNWYYATKAAVQVYMDPRNALAENAIFQFEQLTYNEDYHTLAAVEEFLMNTFMNGSKNAPGTVMTFPYIFYMIAKEEGREISPFHLAARVLQEQGQGTSSLISGVYPGYEGFYNYFNISASGTTNQAIIENGLKYAKEKNWNNAYHSILGGADLLANNYIKRGQDTVYLQKFNVNPDGYYDLYTHQYMQNISAPTTEAASIKKLYNSAGALNSSFVFSIPVYENMPEEPCGYPVPDTKVTISVPNGYSGTEIWLDGISYEGTLKNGLLTVTAPDKNSKTAVMYKYNEQGVPTGMSAWSLSYDGYTYVTELQTGLADLLTYHGFSIRITGNSGIRFKTSISTDLRSSLLSSSGVNGFRLKEYGTLVMTNSNREQLPMILGGSKVLSGISYGKDSSGKLKDVVYETVAGRYRYTSVLTGLPAEQYKTEFAFRGYVILEKDGAAYTFYGPPMAKSIYGLAEQLLNLELYEEGTDTYWFLRNIINDADGLPREPYEPEKTVSDGDAA